MLTTQPVEIILNGIKYSAEVTNNNEIILKRYRSDYKIWVVVSFPNTTNEELENAIRNKLKHLFINQIENNMLTN